MQQEQVELNCVTPFPIQTQGKLRNGYEAGEQEGFQTISHTEPAFFSQSYILIIFPCRKDRK